MLMLLESVPTWRAEVAVVLQYCREVWRASLLGGGPPRRGEMTLTEIARVVAAVDPAATIDHEQGRRKWHNSRGPIAALLLTLHRLSWSMRGPYTLVTDRGDELPLTKYSPALMSQLLQDAVVRSLERCIGAKAAREGDARFQGRRVCLDHVIHRLRTDKKLDAKARAVYRSVLCDAVMTHDKAARSGYLVINRCPHCGCWGDSVHHRVWVCKHPVVAAARDAVAPRWLVEEAVRAGPSSWLFNRGVIPHPGDVWPRPPVDAQMIIYPGGDEMGDDGLGSRTLDTFRQHPPRWADAEGQRTRTAFTAAAARRQAVQKGETLREDAVNLAGQLYVDGSCTTEVFPELRRAASSIVVRPIGGEVEARILIPLCRSLPQTPQAAEYVGLAVPYQLMRGDMKVASDCSNAVRDFQRPFGAAMMPSRRYAGVVRDSWAQPKREGAEIVKVKAHKTWQGMVEGEERCNAIGNDEADVAAKMAVLLHDPPCQRRPRSWRLIAGGPRW